MGRDPNDSVNIVWAPVSLYYPTRSPHGHVTTPRNLLTSTDGQWEGGKAWHEQREGSRGLRRILEPQVGFFFEFLIILIFNFIYRFWYMKYRQTRMIMGPKKNPNDSLYHHLGFRWVFFKYIALFFWPTNNVYRFYN